MRLIHKNQRGFTLIELILVIAITGLIISAITVTIFQLFNISARSDNHMLAVRQVQNAGYWINHDVQMAQNVVPTADADGFPLYVSWREWGTTTADDDILHEVTYTLDGSDFKRSYWRSDTGETSEILVAQYIYSIAVAPISFTVGDSLTLTVTATVGTWPKPESETRVYEVVPRPD